MTDSELLSQVIAWRDEPAKADLRGLPAVSVPALARMREHLPADGARKALTAAYSAAVRLARPQSVLKAASVTDVAELRERALKECDAQARRVASRSGWLAGGSGAALGLGGTAGLVADAPALLVLGMRALIRIGYCYGETPSPALVAGLFALVSADTDEEKREAWNQVVALPPASDVAIANGEAALRDGLERAAERELAKQALNASLQKLAGVLVQRLGAKKAAGALPMLGAVVGGAVNIRFMYRLGEAARMGYAARRFVAEGTALEQLRVPLPIASVAVKKKAATRRAAVVKSAKKKTSAEKPSVARRKSR